MGCTNCKKTATINQPSVTSYFLKLEVDNTVFVMKNGNDVTGLVERFDKPFLTISAARTAALAYFTSRTQSDRVRIVVESGYYREPIYIDNFIDYDLGNSIIESTTVGIATIQVNENNYILTANGVPNAIIYGNAIIRCSTLNTASIHFLAARYVRVVINCDSVYNFLFYAVLMRTGQLLINANTISNGNSAVADRQPIGFATSSSFPEAPVCEIQNAKVFGNQGTSGGATVQFYNGTAGTISTEYSKLILVNCQLGNWSTNRAAIETTVDDGATAKGYGKVYLYNTVIYSNAVYSSNTGCINDYYSLGDKGAIKVYNYGAYSNKNYNLTNPSSSVNIGNLLIDTNIEFNNGIII